MFKKIDYTQLIEKVLKELEALNYTEQFLDFFSEFLCKNLPVTQTWVFMLNNRDTEFALHPFNPAISLEPLTWNSNLVIYLKNSGKTLIMKNETPSRLNFLEKDNPELFEHWNIDIIIPLYSLKKLYGFVAIKANNATYKELDSIEGFFKILSNILIPLVVSERSQLESNRNYFKIYRMDRLAMVGELAASAAHEIKNPLAGISTFLKYFTELKDFKKKDIIEELNIMRQSVQRIDEIVKSLLSFSRFKNKKVEKICLSDIIDSSIRSISLKIPHTIEINKKFDNDLFIETDFQQLQQVVVNILFNAVEAIRQNPGKIDIATYVKGRDQFPSKELFTISIKDNGPGISDSFKEKLFQPFQTTKEEGTGLGLYTCYGLMKSLGGSIIINSDSRGTEVILSLPYSFDEEVEKND